MSEPVGPHTVVRLRGLGADGHGDPIQGEPDRRTIEGCYVIPRFSTEADQRAATVIVGKTLMAPADADVLEHDQIEWESRVYDVEGEPGRYDWSDGEGAALQAALTKATG